MKTDIDQPLSIFGFFFSFMTVIAWFSAILALNLLSLLKSFMPALKPRPAAVQTLLAPETASSLQES